MHVCRARQKAGLKLLDLPYWAERAYLVGFGVYALIENEDLEGESKESTDFQLGNNADSDAFKDILAHLNGKDKDGH